MNTLEVMGSSLDRTKKKLPLHAELQRCFVRAVGLGRYPPCAGSFTNQSQIRRHFTYMIASIVVSRLMSVTTLFKLMIPWHAGVLIPSRRKLL